MADETTQELNDNLDTIEISNEEVELLLTIMLNMNENLELLNTTLTEQGEEENESETETPEDETEVYYLETISDELVVQNTILADLSETQVNQGYNHTQQFAETTEQVTFISEQLEYLNTVLDENAEITYLTQSSVLTYATFYIPLVVIIIALWWFFKNFLNRIR